MAIGNLKFAIAVSICDWRLAIALAIGDWRLVAVRFPQCDGCRRAMWLRASLRGMTDARIFR